MVLKFYAVPSLTENFRKGLCFIALETGGSQ